MVVEGAIHHQLPQRPLAFVHIFQDAVEVGYGVVQLLCKGRVFGNLSDALAGVEVRNQLVCVRYHGVQVVIQRIVAQQFAGRAFSLVQSNRDVVDSVDG